MKSKKIIRCSRIDFKNIYDGGLIFYKSTLKFFLIGREIFLWQLCNYLEVFLK